MCVTEAGRYGIHSMELLLNDMWNRGAKRGNLKAKAFGGATVLNTRNSTNSNFFAVGEVNVRFIKEFLQSERIPLVSSDLGGSVGRVIHFHSVDFSVYVRKMSKTDNKLVKREEHYWKKTLQKQEEASTQVDLCGRRDEFPRSNTQCPMMKRSPANAGERIENPPFLTT